MMHSDRPRHSRASHLSVLAVLAVALSAGSAAIASPVRAGGTAVRAPAPAGGLAGAFWTEQKAVGAASAVSETLHAMAVGTLSGEPSFRVSSALPLSGAPSPVPEPGAAGLLAAGCLMILAVSRRKRPNA